jgi:hypothetical protein
MRGLVRVLVEPLREQKRQVPCHERPELCGRRERAVCGPSVILDPTDQRVQALLAFRCRLLDVEEHGLVLGKVELVPESRDHPSKGRSSVALPVDADEDVALTGASNSACVGSSVAVG